MGMGYLSWSEAETLDATLGGILLAIDGRVDLLQTVFGGKPPDKDRPQTKAGRGGLLSALRMMAGGRKSRTSR